MNSSLRARLANLTQGFWFVPGLITLVLGAVAMITVAVDRAAGPSGVEGTFDGDATAARAILSTIAGSLITVAVLAFSLTVVTLQLVSSQFTPRALRTFLGDRLNQITAGGFVGIFLYCLLALRSVRTSASGQEGFIPALAVTISIFLAVVALALLLAFIHHLASSIQVSNISARITRQTLSRIDALYPEYHGGPVGTVDPDSLLKEWSAIGPPVEAFASRPGYIQVIDIGELFDELGQRSKLRVWVDVAPGDFVTPHSRLIAVWGLNSSQPKGRVHSAIRIDNERDMSQDVGYGIRQLADIALRALSPAVNDPTTALNCIGYLQAIVERLAERTFPSPIRHDEESGALVCARQRGFDELVEDAFVEVGRYAIRDARVAVALIDAVGSAARAAERVGAETKASSLRRAAENLAGPAIAEADTEDDRIKLRLHLAAAINREQPSATPG